MCKQANDRTFCTELGADASRWSRSTPLPKPDWIKESLLLFIEAFVRAEKDNIVGAQALLGQALDLELREWFDVHAQNTGTWRQKAFRVSRSGKVLDLDPIKTFDKYTTPLFLRDNYHCRYCNSKVIPKSVFRKLQCLVGEDALPLRGTNRGRSGYYLMFCATLDHVYPHSLGGRTDESNLVTCCWSCNYGKADYTLPQLGLHDPFSRAPMVDKSWDGLTSLI